MGRFAEREKDIDSLLRSRRFVDLYAVVRQGRDCQIFCVWGRLTIML
jgi:hypothetical protein